MSSPSSPGLTRHDDADDPAHRRPGPAARRPRLRRLPPAAERRARPAPRPRGRRPLRPGAATADGELRTADDELLWALRGGGPSFGVVTSLEFRLYPRSDGMHVASFAHAAMGGTSARTFDQVGTLDDELIGALVATEDATVEIRHWGGRIARDTGAAAHRDAELSVIVDQPASARVAAALHRSGMGSSFLNFLADPSRTATAFTAANWAELRRIKATYDPDRFFSAGHTVPPARVDPRRVGSPTRVP